MSSKGKAECAHCGAVMRRDKLKNHTKSKHAHLSVREKGWKNITSVFSRKRSRLEDDVELHDQDIVVSRENETAGMSHVADVEDTRSASFTDNLTSDMVEELEEDTTYDDYDHESSNTEHTAGDYAHEAPLIDMTLPFPTDPFHFINQPLTSELCEILLAEGPCQPGLNGEFDFPANEIGRRFLPQWYKPKLKNGLQSYRDWLVYSPANDRAYCFPCWLFANRGSPDYEPNFSDPKVGYKRWRDATTNFSKHESCDIHTAAVKVLIETKQRLKLGKSVNAEQERAREREVKENRKILCRLIDVTLFLARQNLAFRGHHESIDRARGTCPGQSDPSQNEGNFLELIKLLANYDAVLAHHLATAPKNASYLSPSIQNEYISSIALVIQDRIVAEIKKAHYFGVIMDSTIDQSHTDQLTFCVRYVDEHFQIQERFLLFTDITESDSESLFDTLHVILNSLGLDLKLIRSQAYDGAANMSGRISGLQTRVKQENELALYVHCCAHNLNLVLCDACAECTDAITFFGTIQKLYNFFTSSQPRHTVLEEAQKEMGLPLKKLHKQSDTRWYCKQAAVKSIKETYPALLIALENLTESERNAETRAESKSLLAFISNMEFLLMLEIWLEILTCIKSLSEYLQRESMDLVTASGEIKSTLKCLEQNRTDEHFQELLDSALAIAEQEDVSTQFSVPRIRRRKRMPGEVARDDPVVDPVKKFRINIFNRIYDTITGELETRFADFHAVVQRFGCLMPPNIGKMEDIEALAEVYEEDIDRDLLIAEYQQFTNFFKDSQVLAHIRPHTVQDMLLAVREHDLDNLFPNLTVLYVILGTIAVSSATAERSFSRLKLVKSYLRSTMSDDRLSALALISIERDFAGTIDYDSVVATFSRMSLRRIAL